MRITRLKHFGGRLAALVLLLLPSCGGGGITTPNDFREALEAEGIPCDVGGGGGGDLGPVDGLPGTTGVLVCNSTAAPISGLYLQVFFFEDKENTVKSVSGLRTQYAADDAAILSEGGSFEGIESTYIAHGEMWIAVGSGQILSEITAALESLGGPVCVLAC